MNIDYSLRDLNNKEKIGRCFNYFNMLLSINLL